VSREVDATSFFYTGTIALMEKKVARQVIVVGDTLAPFGGKVITGSGADTMDGKAVARKTDLVECAKHGVNSISEGDASFLVDGQPVALEGHHASCGCALVSLGATLSMP
jgi:uncharacterized Zn-binding protein involved in type VI secretion